MGIQKSKSFLAGPLAGFTTSEAAQALEITIRTAERYWAFAKAWLYHEMNAP